MADIAEIWRDGTRRDELHAYMIDPHNLDVVRGELTNIKAGTASLTEGYYTDTRISGSIEIAADGTWQDGSWIRLIHTCPDYGYSEELATLIPTKISHTYTSTKFELQSVLWALDADMLPCHYAIGEGATAFEAFRRICDTCGKTSSILPEAHDYRYSSTVVYEIGDSFLSDLFDIANTASDRLSCDAHGRITLAPYIKPANRTEDLVLDMRDTRGIVAASDGSWDEEPWKVSNRSIVVFKGDNDFELIGGADVDATSRYSSARRGYTVAKIHTENDMSPQTAARATELARQYLLSDSTETITRQITTRWLPIHQGDIARLIEADGTSKKYLVKDIDKDCGAWTCDLTLKEI